MASLNTLRTKFGVVLSIVIALALLAFIFSLRTDMGFSNNDPKVGVINGDKIRYSEYLNEYETVKANNGGSEADEQQADAMANAAWQGLIAKHMLLPGFEKMGIEVSEAERMSMLSGEHPSQVYYSAFADPQTGEYRPETISSFLSQVSANPQYQSFWSYLNSQATLDRLMSKYLGMVRAGIYPNALEVEAGVKAANESRSGRYVMLKYNTIADSLVTVSNAEVQKHYPYILFMVLLAFLYIANGFHMQKLHREHNRLSAQVKELRARSLTLSSQRMIATRQSEIIRAVEERGIPLEELLAPPKIIDK